MVWNRSKQNYFPRSWGNRVDLKENDIIKKQASAFYEFSDYYGVPTNFPDLLIDLAYFHPRMNLFNYTNIKEMKELIDKDIDNNN